MLENSGWVLRPAAEADLANIWHHGAASWGLEQADHDADDLFAVFDLLAEYPGLARDRAEFSPPVRINRRGAHLVIYRQAGQGIEIVRGVACPSKPVGLSAGRLRLTAPRLWSDLPGSDPGDVGSDGSFFEH
jgi:toxin ParE1/3/4